MSDIVVFLQDVISNLHLICDPACHSDLSSSIRCCVMSFPYWWLITWFVTRVVQQVSLVEQELFTFPGTWVHPRLIVGIMVILSFADHCSSSCRFSFGHCVVCPSTYDFWLSLWLCYLQTCLIRYGLITNALKTWYLNMMSSEPVFTRAFYSRSKDVCKYTIHWGHFLERRYDTDSLQSLLSQHLLYYEREFLVFTRRFAYSHGSFIRILKINYCPFLLKFFHEKVVIILLSKLSILSVPDEG